MFSRGVREVLCYLEALCRCARPCIGVPAVQAIEDEANDHGQEQQPQTSKGCVAQPNAPLPLAILVPPAWGVSLLSMQTLYIPIQGALSDLQ